MPTFKNQMQVKREFSQVASQPNTLSTLSGVQGWKSGKLLLFGPSIVLEGLIWGPNSWLNYFSSVIIKFPSYATTSGTQELFSHEEMSGIKGNT